LNHRAYEPADGRTNYFLQPNGGSAVKLSYGWATVFAGEFAQIGGRWTPSAATQTATGL
jgi:hypothetical protein